MVSNLYLYSIVAKVKGLAEEARLVRVKKKIAISKKKSLAHYQLAENGLGHDARHHLIAYAFIRGVPYKKVEGKCTIKPDPKKILAIVQDNRYFMYDPGGRKPYYTYSAFHSEEKLVEWIAAWLADTSYQVPVQPLRAKRTPEEIAAMRASSGECAML